MRVEGGGVILTPPGVLRLNECSTPPCTLWCTTTTSSVQFIFLIIYIFNCIHYVMKYHRRFSMILLIKLIVDVTYWAIIFPSSAMHWEWSSVIHKWTRYDYVMAIHQGNNENRMGGYCSGWFWARSNGLHLHKSIPAMTLLSMGAVHHITTGTLRWH